MSAWTYDELKAYNGDIIGHNISLKEDAKPFRQKLRQINSKIAPLTQKELQKMLATSIITPTKHCSRLSSLVVVKKKNGQIRICVDFGDLNVLSKKDNYPLPNMEHLLQRITGFEIISMLDDFSNYNHVLVNEDD